MSKILISKENYFHNLDIICKQAGSKDKIAVVLKDNAYGHGLLEIATLAKEYGIKKAVVANIKEAKLIQKLFTQTLVLLNEENLSYSHTIHMAINSLEDINKTPRNSNIHLKVDTGMHRNGIHVDELEEAIYRISKRSLNLIAIFTHHRSADQVKTDFYYQSRVFGLLKKQVIHLCEQLNLCVPKFHSCNSSALFRTNNFNEDFARVGIAQYGYLENHEIFDNSNNDENKTLKPVLSLWAKKVASRELKKNQAIGYGSIYELKEDSIVSTYDLGYSDGFLRMPEDIVYETKDKYKVLGRVSMDFISINSKEKDLCIFENARSLADIHKTIPYEILTNLKENIKREVI